MLEIILALTEEESHEVLTYLYHKYAQDMLKVAKYHLSKWKIVYFEAEDMVQEAFIRLSKYVDTIDVNGDEMRLRAFMKTVAENVTLTYIRKEYPKKDTVSFEDLDCEPSSEDHIIDEIHSIEEYNRVLAIIRQMKPIYRDALTLRYLYDMDAETIASLTNTPVKTVYTRLERGTSMLSKIFNTN